jgi:F-box and leucine-rich repeat protein 2/20
MANGDALAALGKAAPHLEVVDLSYYRGLHNTALEAFVACSVDEKGVGETVLLTSREAGRDPRGSRRYRRRVTSFRHLSLSSYIMLTDTAYSNLEFLSSRE